MLWHAVAYFFLFLTGFTANASRRYRRGTSHSSSVSQTELLTHNEAVEQNDPSIRLPSALMPVHYLVRLQPFINGNLSVIGFVEITFDVKESTDKIVLHLTDILTRNETVKVFPISDPNQVISIKKQEYNHVKEFYTATLKEKLSQGKTYILCMNFTGLLNDKMKGFYVTNYINDNGTTKFLATTQFEATDARRAFPCFDEPSMKARFSIEIAREKDMKTISNMPKGETIPVEGQEGWFWDRFNTTLPMSTYLIAFLVSDYSYLEGERTDNYLFRVWAPEYILPSAKYAAEIGPKISKFYEEFFNVSFPLPKQDLAAIPEMASGGMENWGLITFGESEILFDPKISTTDDKIAIALTVSHELAHMWFGDLVTLAWWNDLWLNEGFASYLEAVGLREVEPEIQAFDQFLINELFEALSLDSLNSSRPVSNPVGDPNEITGNFDSISYFKGAAIIRMMSSFLSEETLRAALAKYLTDFSYSNAKQNDLWQYLSNQAHEDGTLRKNMWVKQIMDTWTLQMGYPFITVERNENGTAVITQKRFMLRKPENDTSDYKWWVPITFTTQSEAEFNKTVPKVWMMPNESTIEIQGMPEFDEWVIFNVGWYGFYRVNYDYKNWLAIAQQLATDHSKISVSNRAQIIEDSTNLARAGLLSYETVFRMLTYLKKEKHYLPLMAALNNFEYIKNMLALTGGYGLLRNYLLAFIIPLYKEVEFKDDLTDPYIQQVRRLEILKWACSLSYEPCVEAAVDLFDEWMDDPENETIISPNLRSIVYCTGIREGGPKEWRFAFDKYENSRVAGEQTGMLHAAGCTRDIWILAEFLNRSMSDTQIRQDMFADVVPAISQSSIGRFVAWHFLRRRWSVIAENYGTQSFIYDDIMEAVTHSMNTHVEIEELKSFRERYSGELLSGERAVDQALERVEGNADWMEKYYDVIVKWLRNNGYDNGI